MVLPERSTTIVAHMTASHIIIQSRTRERTRMKIMTSMRRRAVTRTRSSSSRIAKEGRPMLLKNRSLAIVQIEEPKEHQIQINIFLLDR
uniref:Uncharacterized protein n=1 Tax=Arundo donax TaxID=35708 RepID=A0A0A9CUS1_ARUDO